MGSGAPWMQHCFFATALRGASALQPWQEQALPVPWTGPTAAANEETDVKLHPLSEPRNAKAASWLWGAAALAASALAIKAVTRATERRHPPQGRFIEVDGVRLHYVERGEGPPLVMLHGMGATTEELESSGLIEEAAQRYRVIAFDRPGYGYSQRPRTTIWTPAAQARLLMRALQALDVEQPIVLAHSWATQTALHMALDHPGQVKGLTLVSGYYYPTPRLDVALFSPPAIPVLGDVLRWTLSPWAGRLLWPILTRKLFGPAPTSARFKAEYPKWMSLRPSQLRASAAESALLIPAAIALTRRYAELDTPLMLVAGQGDRQCLARLHSARLHRHVPHSQLDLVAGQGHMIHHALPQRVLQAVDAISEGEAGLAPHASGGAPEMARRPADWRPPSSDLLH